VQTGYVYGAAHTDILVTIHCHLLWWFGLLCGIAAFLFYFVNDHRLITRSIAVYILAGIEGQWCTV
jgi:uncharacterized membrane protein (UPF0182 family)